MQELFLSCDTGGVAFIYCMSVAEAYCFIKQCNFELCLICCGMEWNFNADCNRDPN